MCLGSFLNNSRANILANRSEPMDTHVMYPTMHQSIMQRDQRKRQHKLRHGCTRKHVYVFARDRCFIWLLHRHGQ